MTYIENIFICMASPLLVAALCMGLSLIHIFVPRVLPIHLTQPEA